jgi:hypothetical protein
MARLLRLYRWLQGAAGSHGSSLSRETLRLVRRPQQRGRRQSTALRSSAVEFSHGLSGSPLSRFPVEALTSEAVRIAVQRVIDRGQASTSNINMISSSGCPDSDKGMHNETRCPCRPRNTNKWPPCGSRRSFSCTQSPLACGVSHEIAVAVEPVRPVMSSSRSPVSRRPLCSAPGELYLSIY